MNVHGIFMFFIESLFWFLWGADNVSSNSPRACDRLASLRLPGGLIDAGVGAFNVLPLVTR